MTSICQVAQMSDRASCGWTDGLNTRWITGRVGNSVLFIVLP